MSYYFYQISAFAHVAREGSFSKAAKRLGVSQSAITQHVAKLEKSTGAQLIVRTRDGLELTQSGVKLFELADRFVTLNSLIAERLKDHEDLQSGHLSIIANAPLPALEIISRFCKAYPQMQVEFALHDWTSAMSLLHQRRADIGIITNPLREDGWVIYPIRQSKYVAYMRHDHPLAMSKLKTLSLRQLDTEIVLLPEKGSLTQRVVSQAVDTHKIHLNRSLKMTTFPLMKEAVLQGIGIGIFLEHSTNQMQGLYTAEIDELPQTFETCLVIAKDKAELKSIKSFADMLDC